MRESVGMCVFVCETEREKEREGERDREGEREAGKEREGGGERVCVREINILRFAFTPRASHILT